MRRIFVGAALAIAGVAAFTEAARHHPETVQRCPNGLDICATSKPVEAGLSPTAYDVLRIAAWALVIVGALLVVTGLIRYWASVRSSV
jgi:uncharacterized membrane protein YphA (DoxX/SURF4 family)